MFVHWFWHAVTILECVVLVLFNLFSKFNLMAAIFLSLALRECWVKLQTSAVGPFFSTKTLSRCQFSTQQSKNAAWQYCWQRPSQQLHHRMLSFQMVTLTWGLIDGCNYYQQSPTSVQSPPQVRLENLSCVLQRAKVHYTFVIMQ